MSDQELFPRTTLELFEELVEVHRAEYDKAVKALDALGDDEKIARAYEKAEDRVAKARRLGAAIDQAAERERKRLITHGPDVSRSVMQESVDIVNSGALDHDGTTVTASLVPAVNPITGEVAPVPVADWECPTCRGDGRLPDKTGGGHHRCKACSGRGEVKASTVVPVQPEPNVSVVVVALYPGDDEPHVTQVGDRTRYGQLVHDYFTAAGLNGKGEPTDWTVLAEDELTAETGGKRSLYDLIRSVDYGKRLLVVAADQGSVTGAPAETVAS